MNTIDSIDSVNSVYSFQNVRLVATDLDGTFLRNDHSVSCLNREALNKLEKHQIASVAATGRNLRKSHEVVGDSLFDFVVFSSGAGILDCRNGEIISYTNIGAETARQLTAFLISADLNFHAFWPAPENHKLWYHRGSKPSAEFEQYFAFHNSYNFPLPDTGKIDSPVCQFLVIIPNDENLFHAMKDDIESRFPEIRVIRSSSPLGTGAIWIEIFHKDVSKGNAIRFLCNHLNINREETLSVGNDFNDTDLLDFTQFSFLTANAAEKLKNRYHILHKTNEEDAFAHIVENILNKRNVYVK